MLGKAIDSVAGKLIIILHNPIANVTRKLVY